MRKIIFLTLRQALLAVADSQGEALVRHVDLWNNQLSYIEEEQPFDTPAVFVEFGPIDWQPLPHGAREAVVSISLHVVTDSRVGRWAEAVGRFDLLDSINAALHGLAYGDDRGNAMDSLSIVRSTTDSDFDELQDNVETYSAHITAAAPFPAGGRPGAPLVAQATPSLSVGFRLPAYD